MNILTYRSVDCRSDLMDRLKKKYKLSNKSLAFIYINYCCIGNFVVHFNLHFKKSSFKRLLILVFFSVPSEIN